jgi:hypothetical protein
MLPRFARLSANWRSSELNPGKIRAIAAPRPPLARNSQRPHKDGHIAPPPPLHHTLSAAASCHFPQQHHSQAASSALLRFCFFCFALAILLLSQLSATALLPTRSSFPTRRVCFKPTYLLHSKPSASHLASTQEQWLSSTSNSARRS